MRLKREGNYQVRYKPEYNTNKKKIERSIKI